LTTRSRLILAVQSLLLRTAGTPLGSLWALGYRLAARAWAAYLARGEPGATTYVRGSLGVNDALPGLSDVDVAVVLAEDPRGAGIARMRVRERWQRLRRRLPATDLLLDFPLILERRQLADVVGASALTLDGAAYHGSGFSEDKVRMLERPGLYDATGDWRLMSGRDGRPDERPRDAGARRIAAWLELVYWWQWMAPACADPGPRTASLCVKAIAEPARVWLWLAHGERAADRADALRRALRRLPEEADGLELGLALQRSLSRSPEPPLAAVLPVLARLSGRIEELLAGEIEGEGTTEVRLAGGEPLLPHGSDEAAAPLPLADWRALVQPKLADETFALRDGDPADPHDLAAAARASGFGPQPALRAGRLMVIPGPRWRTELRALKSPVSDPVSFALVEGRDSAQFPNVRGWSAADTARRALVEQRAWLEAGTPPPSGLPPSHAAGGILAMLFSAARAALFHESIARGVPELPLTAAETARRLGERSSAAGEAFERYRAFAIEREPPPPATIDAFRRAVEELLDPLGDPPGLLAVEQ
jgi:hypothetical protein